MKKRWVGITIGVSLLLAVLAVGAILPTAAETPGDGQPSVAASSPASIDSGIAQTRNRAEVEFTGGAVEEEAGDITEVTVSVRNTRTAYLVVGGPGVGFLDVVELNDRNDNGEVTVQINTRYIGLNPNSPGVPSVRSYRATSSGDSVTALRPSDELANPQGQTLSELRSALNIDSTPARPIRAGDYNMFVTTTTDLQRVSGNQLDIVNERDSNTLSLSTPSVGDAESFAAPRGAASSGSLSTVRSLSQRDEIAMGDRVAIRIDVSGVFGHLDAEHRSNVARGIVDNGAEGISLTVEQTNPSANREPITLDLSSQGVDLRLDESNNQIYAVIDTRSVQSSRSIEAGQNYRAEFRLRGVSSEETRYDVRSDANNNRAHRGYPYLQPGQTRTASTTFQLRDRNVRVNNLVSNQLELPAEERVTISGTTNIAPQSSLQIRTRGTSGTDLLETTTATVRSDGTWQTQQDFSGLTTDDTFQSVIRDETGVLRTVDGSIVEDPPETEPEDDAVDESDDDTDDTADDSSTADDSTDEDDETDDSATLGAVVPIVALLMVTVLLAARRSQY